MSVGRIKDLPYPEKKFESHEDVWEYCKELRNALQEDQSERIEDFDVLKLDNMGWEDVRGYAKNVKKKDGLANAISKIGSTETTLLISNQQDVTASATIPSNIAVKVLKGGSLTSSNSATVTFNGQFEAGLYQVFEGNLVVAFGSGSVKEVYPDWWTLNSIPGTTDMATAIQSALDSGIKNIGILSVSGGYLSNTNLTIPTGVKLFGIGAGAKIITTSAILTLIDTAAAAVDVILENLTLEGSAAVDSDPASIGFLTGTTNENIKIINCHFDDFNIGIFLSYQTDTALIEKCNFENMVYNTTLAVGGYAIIEEACSNVKILHNTTANTVERHHIYLSKDSTIPADGSFNILIDNNIFHGIKAGGATGYESIIHVRKIDHLIISNNYIEGGYGAINFGDANELLNDISIADNIFYDQVAGGSNNGVIHTSGAAGALVTNISITGNVIIGDSDITYALYLNKITGGVFSNNIIRNTQRIYLNLSIIKCSFVSNEVYDISGAFIYVSDLTGYASKDLIISDNIFDTSTSHGIEVSYVQDFIIKGNIIRNVPAVGGYGIIALGSAAHPAIGLINSNFIDTVANGLKVQGSGTFNEVVENNNEIKNVTTTYKVIETSYLYNSVAWNPGEIANGAEAEQAITITGAVLGDYAIASLSVDTEDLGLSAVVSSSSTVSVSLFNDTGGALDINSGNEFTLYVKVIKR